MEVILVANGVAAALCIMVLFNRSKRTPITTVDDRIFLALCVLTMVQAGLETLSFLLDGQVYPGSRGIYLLINTLLFSFSSLMGSLWMFYVDYKLFESTERLRKRALLYVLPALVMQGILVINLFAGIIFTVGPDGVYHRTSWTVVVFLFNYAYMTLGMVGILYYRRKLNKYIFLPAVLFLAPIYLASLLQMLFYGLSLLWVGTAIGLNALYINLQNEVSYIDPLTGAYNRSYLYAYLTNQWRKGVVMAGMMLDLNGFKSINDTYGHLEGDAALQTVGQLLRKTVGRECLVARYAGDEFVVILKENRPLRAAQIARQLHQAAEEYNRFSGKPYAISFSIGVFDAWAATVDDFFRKMDQAMYKEKLAFYSYPAEELEAE